MIGAPRAGFGVFAALCAGLAGTVFACSAVLTPAPSTLAADLPGSAVTDPEKLWQNIRDEYRHGNLDSAHARAEHARIEFAATDGQAAQEWSLKFRLLDAEILNNQRRSAEVVALLSDPKLRLPVSGDAAIQRELQLGLAQLRLGQSREAERSIARARRRAEAAHSAMLGEVLKGQATLTDAKPGQREKALALAFASLKFARAQKDAYLEASDLSNIGYFNMNAARFEQAVLFLQDAVRLARAIGSQRTLDRALGNLGWAHLSLGDFEKALGEFKEAEDRARAIGLEREAVGWLQYEGLAEAKLDDLYHARESMEGALRQAQELGARELIVEIQTNLIVVLYEQGHFDEALRSASDLLSDPRVHRNPSVMTNLLLVKARIAARHGDETEAERMLQRALASGASFPYLRLVSENQLAVFYAQHHRSRLAERYFRRSLATFESQRASVRDEGMRLSLLDSVDTLYEDYADFLVDTKRSDLALRLLDRCRARTRIEGLGGHAIPNFHAHERHADVHALARVLGAPLLFYAVGPDRSYLWTITAQGTRLSILPSQREIRAHLAAYRKLVMATRDSNDPIGMKSLDGQWLYTQLLGPAADLIPPNTKVYVIPDTDLYSLNFETLLKRDAAGVHYWIEDVTLTTAGSIELLAKYAAHSGAARHEGPAPDRDLLLIGDPVAAGAEFPALEGAAKEVNMVRSHFAPDRQTVVTRDRALPGVYATSEPERFRYIHFVAHGTASRTSPLDSAVVLSPTPESPESFMLYARDIVRLPLVAELVTVSACYGSGERAYAGEGLVGLAWAFLRAGSHHVVSALWEVDDASTPRLMDALYGELMRGAPPAAALRTAKLGLLRAGGAQRKPRYWAAFQLYAGG